MAILDESSNGFILGDSSQSLNTDESNVDTHRTGKNTGLDADLAVWREHYNFLLRSSQKSREDLLSQCQHHIEMTAAIVDCCRERMKLANKLIARRNNNQFQDNT